jgi:hypothetical protein
MIDVETKATSAIAAQPADYYIVRANGDVEAVYEIQDGVYQQTRTVQIPSPPTSEVTNLLNALGSLAKSEIEKDLNVK